MSSPVENDPAVDMFGTLATRGGEVVTAPTANASESMLRKCLHPPSAVPGFDGLPTNDARTQVLLQYSDISINKTPVIIDRVAGTTRAVTAADLNTFNVAILSLNGLRVNSIRFIWNSVDQSMQQDLANVDILDAYDAKQFGLDAQLYRPIYKSTTALLNATYFNNTGIVACNQTNPNILFAGTILALSLEKPSLFYDFYQQRHLELLRNGGVHTLAPRDSHYAKALSDFVLFPTYIQDEIRKKLSLAKDHVPAIDPNTSIQIINFGQAGLTTGAEQPSFVPTPSQLLNQSQRAYAGKACEGVFSVQRLNTVSPAWQTAGNTNNTGNHGLYQCYVAFIDNAGALHVNALLDNAPAGTLIADIPVLTDTLWTKDMTCSWMVFEGLSLNSQTNTSFQLLIAKYYSGFEVQPALRSSWAGLTRLAPKPDLVALQAMMDGFYELKDGMPARYNFWGTIGTVLGPLALQAGGSILKWLTGKIGGAPSAAPNPAAVQQPATPQRPVVPPRPSRQRPVYPMPANAGGIYPSLSGYQRRPPPPPRPPVGNPQSIASFQRRESNYVRNDLPRRRPRARTPRANVNSITQSLARMATTGKTPKTVTVSARPKRSSSAI